MDVVNPYMAIGTIAPGVSDDDASCCTRAAEGMLFAIEVTSGTGPVTVMMEGGTRAAGGVMGVLYAVTVVTRGVGRMMVWIVSLMVTEYVVSDWDRMSAGADSAKPRRDIVKNML